MNAALLPTDRERPVASKSGASGAAAGVQASATVLSICVREPNELERLPIGPSAPAAAAAAAAVADVTLPTLPRGPPQPESSDVRLPSSDGASATLCRDRRLSLRLMTPDDTLSLSRPDELGRRSVNPQLPSGP